MSNATLIGFDSGFQIQARGEAARIVTVDLEFRHDDGYTISLNRVPAADYVGRVSLGDRFCVQVHLEEQNCQVPRGSIDD